MIDITVHDKVQDGPFLKPIDVHGAEHGKIFQQYVDAKPENVYLVGAGLSDNPIMIWYDDEPKEYRVSSCTRKELKDYYSHVLYKEIDANLDITLDIYK
jgi:hypothetical protein